MFIAQAVNLLFQKRTTRHCLPECYRALSERQNDNRSCCLASDQISAM